MLQRNDLWLRTRQSASRTHGIVLRLRRRVPLRPRLQLLNLSQSAGPALLNHEQGRPESDP